ncbi:MAG: hypothetical protein WCO09_05250 [bacterium]
MHRIAGNDSFGKCRGEFGDLDVFSMLSLSNPTQTLKALDEAVAPIRVMLHLLARLKRDGWTHAYNELLAALIHRDHIFTGEVVPIEAREDGTLVIVDLEDTLLLLRWLYTTDYCGDIIPYVRGENPDRGLYGSLTKQTFERFPSIRDELVERVKYTNGYRDTAMFVNPPAYLFGLEKLDQAWKTLEKFYRPIKYQQRISLIADYVNTDGHWSNRGIVAIFITGVSQKEVISSFPRSEQDRISTWQFKFPKIHSQGLCWGIVGPNMLIGLHPESEHQKWCDIHPSYISHGVTHGLGAIMLTKDMVGRESNGFMRGTIPMYTTLGIGSVSEPPADISSQRLLLAFPFR